jgi:hypothetical protein
MREKTAGTFRPNRKTIQSGTWDGICKCPKNPSLTSARPGGRCERSPPPRSSTTWARTSSTPSGRSSSPRSCGPTWPPWVSSTAWARPSSRCRRPSPAIGRTGSASARSSSGRAISAAPPRGSDTRSRPSGRTSSRSASSTGPARSAARRATPWSPTSRPTPIAAGTSGFCGPWTTWGPSPASSSPSLSSTSSAFGCCSPWPPSRRSPGPRSSSGTSRSRREPRGRVFKGFAFRDIDRNLALYIILNGVFALGAFTYSFLLLNAKEAGFKTGFIPVLYLVYSVAAALLSYPFGRLSDRVGRKPVLFLAFGAWAAVCAGAAFVPGLPAAASLFVLYGLHKAALEPVQKTIAAELAPERFRASVLGGFQMVVGLAALPASLLAGFLWDKAGRQTPFIVSLGLTAAAALLLLFVRETRRGEEGSPACR